MLKRLASACVVAATLAASQFAYAADPENTLVITLKDGDVTVALRPDLAPKHVAQIKKLVREGAYDNVAFHRVIGGFMSPYCTSPVCAMKPSMTRWKATLS